MKGLPELGHGAVKGAASRGVRSWAIPRSLVNWAHFGQRGALIITLTSTEAVLSTAPQQTAMVLSSPVGPTDSAVSMFDD